MPIDMTMPRPKPPVPLMRHVSAAVAASAAWLIAAPCFAFTAAPVVTPPECQAHTGYDRDLVLPGYLLPTRLGVATCVPFTVPAQRPPAGYKGDFYVDEFTDAKLRERWKTCKADPGCSAKVGKIVNARRPPHREHRAMSPRETWLLGRIDSDNPNVDLKTVRRPAFFARAPWHEAIAEDEGRAWTVEFTGPPEPYERIALGWKDGVDDVKMRGWYFTGAGVPDGKGGKMRALIVTTHGGGGRTTSIEDPHDRSYYFDPFTGRTVNRSYPDELSGTSGERGWREMVHRFLAAGFDVLDYDRRGVGISSGMSDTNTVQQGRDILKMVSDLKTGAGLRALSPAGAELRGSKAADALTGGHGELPVVLFGESRGTMSSAYAMEFNFDRNCNYDVAVIECGPPVGLKNIKGVMNVSDYTPGIGYLTSPTDERDSLRPLYTAGTQEAYNLIFFPSASILGSVPKWPAVFIGRGLWDYGASLEGAVDVMRRATGLKELLVVRAGHPMETFPDEEKDRLIVRMTAFATAAVQGAKVAPGARTWTTMKELAATASDVWEPSSDPQFGQ